MKGKSWPPSTPQSPIQSSSSLSCKSETPTGPTKETRVSLEHIEMKSWPPATAQSPIQSSSSSSCKKETTLSLTARESTCDIVESSETRLGPLTLESTGRIPTHSISDSLVSSGTFKDDVGLFSSLSEGHAVTFLTRKKLKLGIFTSSQDQDYLQFKPKATSEREPSPTKESLSFDESSQLSLDLRAVESETSSPLLYPIQTSDTLLPETPFSLSRTKTTEFTKPRPSRALSDSVISTGTFNEDRRLSSEVESYTTCVGSELFLQSKRFSASASEPFLRREVYPVKTDSTSSSSLEGDGFLSADEDEIRKSIDLAKAEAVKTETSQQTQVKMLPSSSDINERRHLSRRSSGAW